MDMWSRVKGGYDTVRLALARWFLPKNYLITESDRARKRYDRVRNLKSLKNSESELKDTLGATQKTLEEKTNELQDKSIDLGLEKKRTQNLERDLQKTRSDLEKHYAKIIDKKEKERQELSDKLTKAIEEKEELSTKNNELTKKSEDLNLSLRATMEEKVGLEEKVKHNQKLAEEVEKAGEQMKALGPGYAEKIKASIPNLIGLQRKSIHELHKKNEQYEAERASLIERAERREKERSLAEGYVDIDKDLALFILDPLCKIVQVSTAGERLFGKKESELKDEHFGLLFHYDESMHMFGRLLTELGNTYESGFEKKVQILSPDKVAYTLNLNVKLKREGKTYKGAIVTAEKEASHPIRNFLTSFVTRKKPDEIKTYLISMPKNVDNSIDSKIQESVNGIAENGNKEIRFDFSNTEKMEIDMYKRLHSLLRLEKRLPVQIYFENPSDEIYQKLRIYEVPDKNIKRPDAPKDEHQPVPKEI